MNLNIKREIQKEEFELQGYEMMQNIDKYKECETLRGSLMFIRKGINYKPVEFKSNLGALEEGLFAEITLNGNDTLLCATIYRRGESTNKNNEFE